jgi:phosphopantothenoylcysteine synthetase/decarboxylase
MELNLVTTDNKVKVIEMEKFLENAKKDNFYYFSRETSYKNIQDLIDELKAQEYSVYFREVKYSLEDNGYMYELHIL